MQTHNPFDWNSVLAITNNKYELAKELIQLFIAELPIAQANIQNAYHQKNYADLLDHIHKFHGSSCYCGVPKLKELNAIIENNLKQKEYAALPLLMSQLNEEIDAVLQFIKINPNLFEENL